jgi:hypothetical protein
MEKRAMSMATAAKGSGMKDTKSRRMLDGK